MTDRRNQYSYDETPYPSHSFAYTHPDCLATVATLLGMDPAPVEQCRVLELGCASGGNLLPMAYSLPRSQFVGIDLSARQITEGQANVTTLGLQNITNVLQNGPRLRANVERQIAHLVAFRSGECPVRPARGCAGYEQKIAGPLDMRITPARLRLFT